MDSVPHMVQDPENNRSLLLVTMDANRHTVLAAEQPLWAKFIPIRSELETLFIRVDLSCDGLLSPQELSEVVYNCHSVAEKYRKTWQEDWRPSPGLNNEHDMFRDLNSLACADGWAAWRFSHVRDISGDGFVDFSEFASFMMQPWLVPKQVPFVLQEFCSRPDPPAPNTPSDCPGFGIFTHGCSSRTDGRGPTPSCAKSLWMHCPVVCRDLQQLRTRQTAALAANATALSYERNPLASAAPALRWIAAFIFATAAIRYAVQRLRTARPTPAPPKRKPPRKSRKRAAVDELANAEDAAATLALQSQEEAEPATRATRPWEPLPLPLLLAARVASFRRWFGEGRDANAVEDKAQPAAELRVSQSRCDSSEEAPPQGEKSESSECVVCFDQRVTHAVIPCGHLVLCSECANMIMGQEGRQCPVCRQPAREATRIFGHASASSAPGPSKPASSLKMESMKTPLISMFGLAGVSLPGLMLGTGLSSLGRDGTPEATDSGAYVYFMASIGLVLVYLVHCYLVPIDSDAMNAPPDLILAYYGQTMGWLAQIYCSLQLELDLTQEVDHALDLARAVAMGSVTLIHGYLLNSSRIKPWPAIRNIAAVSPAVTVVCMLCGWVVMPEAEVWTPNHVPLPQQTARIVICALVSVACTKGARFSIVRAWKRLHHSDHAAMRMAPTIDLSCLSVVGGGAVASGDAAAAKSQQELVERVVSETTRATLAALEAAGVDLKAAAAPSTAPA